MSRPTKFRNLINETGDSLNIQATRLCNACPGRPEAEALELMSIASSLRRLYGRVAKRAQSHEKKVSEVSGS